MSFSAHAFPSMRIVTPDDIVVRAQQFESIAAAHGLRVLPWHNLGSTEPMMAADGEFLCSSVFGWTGKDECWHSLAQRSISPTANLSRYHPEPFWVTVGSKVQSRHFKHDLEKIDLSDLWAGTDVKGFMIVPVHLYQGQVGLVGFMTDNPQFDFEDIVDDMSRLSWEFITSYTLVRSREKGMRQIEPLSAREIDCLKWAFYGKTDREIAEITGRSYATVRFHILSCASKLNSVNRAQTLAKAATLGYFASYN